VRPERCWPRWAGVLRWTGTPHGGYVGGPELCPRRSASAPPAAPPSPDHHTDTARYRAVSITSTHYPTNSWHPSLGYP
jgi:hypothetical protein